MEPTLLVHVTAGAVSLLTGYTALYAAKGGKLHRKSGMVFVYAMLTMTLTGLVVTVVRQAAVAMNTPAALLTAYLVATSLLTVRPPARPRRWLDVALMLLAAAVGLVCLGLGLQVLGGGGGRGMPAFPFFLFGVIGTLASALDLRMLRAGGLQGKPRLARHLWRMCCALLIAAMSFFFGQADEIPEPVRIMPLLALPVLAVLVTMFYWLWRVRLRRAGPGIARQGLDGSPAALSGTG